MSENLKGIFLVSLNNSDAWMPKKQKSWSNLFVLYEKPNFNPANDESPNRIQKDKIGRKLKKKSLD